MCEVNACSLGQLGANEAAMFSCQEQRGTPRLGRVSTRAASPLRGATAAGARDRLPPSPYEAKDSKVQGTSDVGENRGVQPAGAPRPPNQGKMDASNERASRGPSAAPPNSLPPRPGTLPTGHVVRRQDRAGRQLPRL